MTKIKTVRERTSVQSQLAGIVAVVAPPLSGRNQSQPVANGNAQ